MRANLILRKIQSHKWFFIFLGVMLLAGILLAKNYGETADDEYLQIYASRTVEVYGNLLTKAELSDPTFDNLHFYGPAFVTFAQVGQNLLQGIIPSVDAMTGWHFYIFLSFLVGVAALYSICLHLFPKSVSLIVCILYATQPLLWGQGFLNAKDTPLLSFFLLAVALGLKLEGLFTNDSWKINEWRDSIVQEYRAIPQRMRARLICWFRGFLIFTGIMIVSSLFWQGWLSAILGWILSTDPHSWVGRIFSSIAPNANSLPLSGYVSKGLTYLNLIVLLIGVGWLLCVLALASIALPKARRTLTKNIVSTIGMDSRRFWSAGTLWVAAIGVGIATAIRIVGPFAALLVLIFLLLQKGPRVFGLVAPYLVGIALTTYLLWPFLWTAPIKNFLDSFNLMSNFPWGGRILFQGDLIPPRKLPAGYLPTLIGIQFTIPAIALALAGFALAMTRFVKSQRALITTIIFWFLLPLIYVIVAKPALYHNFRQFLFIVPPIFIFVGFALVWLKEHLKIVLVFWTVVVVAILPGLVAIVQLHPYEYVYYNEFVGGVAGAQGQYEMEYWRTSFTEITRKLNEFVPQNSFVVSWGSAQIVERVARPDLQVENLNAQNYLPSKGYDYVIIGVRGPNGRYLFTGFPEVITISRLGATLAIVNQLNCCATLDP